MPGTFLLKYRRGGELESPRALGGGPWTRSFDTPSEITQNHATDTEV